MSVPKQRDQALSIANRNRIAGSQLRKRVVAREVTMSSLIEEPPEEIRGLLVWNVLLWQPRWGIAKLSRLNRKAVMGHRNLATTVGGLSPRTRRWLVYQLRSQGR